MIFHNRAHAGKLLSEKLIQYKGKEETVILGLPRGGIVVAAETAKALSLPLDIVVPRKIGAPENPEYAIGAITETGEGVWNEEEIARVDKVWLQKEIDKEKTEARRRLKTYRGQMPPRDLKQKTVILVDDGIATGLTMRAAIKSVRARGAKKVIVAVPTGARDSLIELEREAHEAIVLDKPIFFGAVGAFYEEFPQVEDEEVIKIMKTQEH